MTDFYKFVCAAEDEPDSAELLIFAPIGDWEDMGEIGAKMFARDLSKVPASVKRLDIHINSPGGSLFDASAIYSRLADHRSVKHVYVDGLAASAATIIAMVGHKIFMRANATMMIHMPSGVVVGNADDMRSVAGALDTVTESMVNVYEKRTGQSREDIMDMLKAETWFTPEQAVKLGFADEVRGVVKAAATMDGKVFNFNGQEFDLSRFHKIPAFIATSSKQPKENMKPKAEAEGGGDKPTESGTKTEQPPKKEGETSTPAVTPPQTQQPLPQQDPPQNYADGIADERARVAALQELDRPETHDIVTAAIKEGKTASDIFGDVMKAMDQAKMQNDRRADASQLGRIPSSDVGEDTTEAESFGSLLKAKVKDRLKSRGFRVAVNGRN